MKTRVNFPVRLILLLLIGSVLLFLYIKFGIFEEARNMQEEQPPRLASEILGLEESCMGCHGDMRGFAPLHDPRNIGCSPCHLGNPRAETAEEAHRDMVLVPGNLTDMYQTCGTVNCHHELAVRVDQSLMTTMAGVVNVDRFVFGESDSLSAFAHVQELGHSAADQHLRHLCASCHLGNEKNHPAPISERSRGGGCNACHLNYSDEAIRQLHAYYPGKEADRFPQMHPALTLEITNDHCFGCHSRSGRISLNYEGWHETHLQEHEVETGDNYRLLEDRRIVEFIQSDVHHQAGLDCIDCHNALEVMGDGTTYFHEEDAVKIKCEHCHFQGTATTLPYAELDTESKKILSLRKIEFEGMEFLHDPQSGRSYLNGLVDEDGKAWLIGKNTGERYPLNPPAPICTRGNAHDDLSCSSCHTAWAPQCIGCHNAYEPEMMAFDLLDDKRTQGKWEEYLGIFLAEPPTLGVVQTLDDDGKTWRTVKPFIPGMIMTIDQSDAPGKTGDELLTFHRLFAPVAPHTTSRNGRSCKSCHNNPLALGFGRGELTFDITQGKWLFEPEYIASEYDGLPQDAWIGFLEEAHDIPATRANARPFTVAEQHRILEVGACLTCHADDSAVMLNALDDFEKTLERISDQCVTFQN